MVEHDVWALGDGALFQLAWRRTAVSLIDLAMIDQDENGMEDEIIEAVQSTSYSSFVFVS